MSVLKSGNSRDPDIAAISRNIFMLCAEFDISLLLEHVAGKENSLADLLSRWSNSNSDRLKLRNLLLSHRWLTVREKHFWEDNTI